MAKRSPRRILVGMMVLSAIGLGIFFMVKGCTDDISPDKAGVILETNGKKYLYAPVGSVAVKQSIEQNKSPQAFPNVIMYKDGDALFVDPRISRELINLMYGNYELFNYKEKSYDGYVTVDFGEAYSLQNSYLSTETVGKQKSHNVLTLKNKKGKEMKVIWDQDPSTGEFKAVLNCEVRGFWTETHPAPGETVISSEDRFVVSLKKLAKFFGCKYSYNRETKVLTIKR